MFYCPKCNYIFDISKINSMVNTTDNESKSQRSSDDQRSASEGQPGGAVIFSCNNCGNVKKIKPETLILSKTYGDVSQKYVADGDKYMADSKILPHTKNYTCPNKNCVTHKDPNKKDAKMYKVNKTYRLKYICMLCKTVFEL